MNLLRYWSFAPNAVKFNRNKIIKRTFYSKTDQTAQEAYQRQYSSRNTVILPFLSPLNYTKHLFCIVQGIVFGRYDKIRPLRIKIKELVYRHNSADIGQRVILDIIIFTVMFVQIAVNLFKAAVLSDVAEE